MTDRFPEREGKWEVENKGYQVVKETSEEKTVKENSLLHTKNHRKKKGIPAHGFFLIKLAANFTGKGVGTEERQYYKEEGRP